MMAGSRPDRGGYGTEAHGHLHGNVHHEPLRGAAAPAPEAA